MKWCLLSNDVKMYKYLILNLCWWGFVAGWIDISTTVLMKKSQHDGRIMELVASDEFKVSGRSFESGYDAMFEAMTKPDDTNDSLQFCKLLYTLR